MSDVMPPQAGGMEGKESVFNPADAALKATRGDIRPDMSIEEFLNKNFGVSARDPLQKLIEATRTQVRNKNIAGKLGMEGSQSQPVAPASPLSAPPPRPQRPAISSPMDLANMIGR